MPWKGVAAALRLCCAVLALQAVAARAAEPQDRDRLHGPDVTIIGRQDKTIVEFRQGGELRMIKVVPKWGKPYYLVPRDPTKGFGDLERADMLLPSWVIIQF